jgi:glycosyltransferase involved in cell wall biosynthesis
VKVLQLIDSLEPGGAERMAVNLANALFEQGCEPHLMATRCGGALEQTVNPSVPVVILNKKHTMDEGALKRAIRYVKNNAITIVHAHTTSYFFATLLKINVPNIRLIWHEHHGFREHTTVWNNKALYCCSYFFSAIVTVNETLQTWCRKNLKAKTVAFLPNFVLQQKDGVPSGTEKKTIVCLANLKAPKNHLNLIRAFSIVAAQFPDWSLHLIGRDFDDRYTSDIKNYLRENDLWDKVLLLGSRDDIPVVLQQASIGVIASDSEGLPMALLEYGMAGLAVVTTDVGQCREVVSNHGLVVPPNDPKALSEAIMTYIDQAGRRKSDAAAFQAHVGKNYTFEAIWPRLKKLYAV